LPIPDVDLAIKHLEEEAAITVLIACKEIEENCALVVSLRLGYIRLFEVES